VIDALVNIPSKALEIDKNKVYTPKKANIIIVFLDNNYNIIDVDKKTYDDWMHDERITSENALLLDCQKFIGLYKDQPNRKGFGGQNGMSTFSPIHFKLTDTYIKAISNYINGNPTKPINKKLENFISANSGLKNSPFYESLKEKLVRILEKIFLESFAINEQGSIVFPPSDHEILVKPNDFLLILLPSQDINYYLGEYKRYISERLKRTNKTEIDAFCFICNKRITSGVNLSVGNFEGTQGKHKQLFHKFYGKVFSQPNIFICEECDQKMKQFFDKVLDLKKKFIPIPLNVRDSDFFEITFNQDISLLEKLKNIYKKNNENPFDYILLVLNGKDSNNFVLEYIPNFRYKLDTNLEALELSINYYEKKEGKNKIRQKLIKEDPSTKSYFFFALEDTFLKKGLIRYYLFSNNDLKGQDPLLKLLFYEFKDPIINMLLKENYWFQREGIKKLIKRVLQSLCSSKILKEKVAQDTTYPKRILTYYLLYSPSGGVKMEIKSIKELEEQFDNYENIELNDTIAAYLMGQVFYYLLEKSKSKKEKLDLLGTYLLSVKSMDDLKRKIIDLTLHYKHNLTNSKKWKIINQKVLSYDFEKNKFDDNIIPFFIGFYSDNIFYKTKEVEKNE